MKTSCLLLLIMMVVWCCDRNHAPVISGISCSPDSRNAGTLFTLKVTATDEDGNSLQYRWTADGGRFADSTNRVQTTWKSPADGNGQTYTLTATVSDGKLESSMDYSILLSEPVFGMISGFVYYSGCTIPIQGASVSVDEVSSKTDSTGFFHLTNIPVGHYSLKGSKDGYSPVDLSVNIQQSVETKVNIYMTTVTYSSKVYGIVKSRDSLPIGGATVVMLNPDLSESNITATTDTKGSYLLRYVPYGQRKIIARKKSTDLYGFKDTALDLLIQVSEYPLDIEMEKYPLTGQFTDPRDEHVYGYRIIGTQTWMTENLAYLPGVSPSSVGNDLTINYYVYDYEGASVEEAKNTDNYANYGVLYNWKAASLSCPVGWHLPSNQEWNILENYLGPDAGYHMKSKAIWPRNGGGDNSSGFNALPAGGRIDPGFTSLGTATGFWSSTDEMNLAKQRVLSYLDNWFSGYSSKKRYGSSVRCVKE